ncbi:MAG: ECF transporter S component [Anaerolineales bacterium]
MTKKLLYLVIGLILAAILMVLAYILIPLSQKQDLGSLISASDVPIRFLFVGIGAVIVLGIYYFTRQNAAWTVGTREVVYMGIGAALYGVLSWLFNGTVFAVPSISQVALRPGIAIPILFGYLFGPVVGFFTGLVGNTIGDLLSGWVSPQWSFGNGLIGLIAGMAFFFGDKKRSLNGLLIVSAVGAVVATVVWLLNRSEVNQMAAPWDQPLTVAAGISALIGLAIVAAIRFIWSKEIDVAASVVWGSLGIILGIGFAAIADIWVNGYSPATAIVGEFIPAAGPNLIQAAILVPLLLVAYKAVQKQTGR